MKLSSAIYKVIKNIYDVMPGKKFICQALKHFPGFPVNKFYKDFKFSGAFEVDCDGHQFKMIHHRSTIENEIFWHGLGKTWEADTIWIWKELCRDATTIFDIGANTGAYSLIAATLNPGATIYAFEPAERTYRKLVTNAAINGYTNIRCEMIALSSANGEATFYDVPDENQTSASLSDKKLKNFEGYQGEILEYKVKTSRPDTYMAQNNIQSVDLVKLDVEMHEPEVLRGFGDVLNRFRPTLVVEVLSDEIGRQIEDLVNGCGYEIFHLHRPYSLKRSAQIRRIDGWWNYLLCPKQVSERLTKFIVS
ncbi:MAG: FkbM family methyltransferase [Chitinophagales bacterium]|nr:FkbM family methyltransferase [Chitinophagales bacterium]MDW8419736.1 FkbM family methyltransferase [Chitinophagales bacterium]